MRWTPCRLLQTLVPLTMVGAALPDQSASAAEWQRLGELGLAAARGNSNSETLNGRIELRVSSGSWEHQFGGDLTHSRGSSRGALDAQTELLTQRIEFNASTAYTFSPTRKVLASLRHEEDRLGAYSEQSVFALNLGLQLIESPAQQLSLSFGPGYRHAQLAETSSTQDWVARASLDYSRELTANTTLTQQSLMEAGRDNTYLQSDLALAVKLNGHLSLKTAFQLRHNSEVAPGAVATDRLLTTTLAIGF